MVTSSLDSPPEMKTSCSTSWDRAEQVHELVEQRDVGDRPARERVRGGDRGTGLADQVVAAHARRQLRIGHAPQRVGRGHRGPPVREQLAVGGRRGHEVVELLETRHVQHVRPLRHSAATRASSAASPTVVVRVAREHLAPDPAQLVGRQPQRLALHREQQAARRYIAQLGDQPPQHRHHPQRPLGHRSGRVVDAGGLDGQHVGDCPAQATAVPMVSSPRLGSTRSM